MANSSQPIETPKYPDREQGLGLQDMIPNRVTIFAVKNPQHEILTARL